MDGLNHNVDDATVVSFLRNFVTSPADIHPSKARVGDILVLCVSPERAEIGIEERVALRVIEVDDSGQAGADVVYKITGRVMDSTAPNAYPIHQRLQVVRRSSEALYGFIIDSQTVSEHRAAYTLAEQHARAADALTSHLVRLKGGSLRPAHALRYLENVYHLPPSLYTAGIYEDENAIPKEVKRKRQQWLIAVVRAGSDLRQAHGYVSLKDPTNRPAVRRHGDRLTTRKVIRVDSNRLANGIKEVLSAFDIFEVE